MKSDPLCPRPARGAGVFVSAPRPFAGFHALHSAGSSAKNPVVSPRARANIENSGTPMARIVMKFGGTSVADLDRIHNVAGHVKREVDAGHEVAVVVSAMSGKTNELVAWVQNMPKVMPSSERKVRSLLDLNSCRASLRLLPIISRKRRIKQI